MVWGYVDFHSAKISLDTKAALDILSIYRVSHPKGKIKANPKKEIT